MTSIKNVSSLSAFLGWARASAVGQVFDLTRSTGCAIAVVATVKNGQVEDLTYTI